jgi:DNA-binding GntR family transcriptional regulator
VNSPVDGPADGTGGAVRDTGSSVASHRIAGELRAAILDGRYLPGERIRQEELAARSGASRIPVREALRMLQSEGLVTLVANSGAWVSKLSLAECSETYLIRERLEPLLLRTSIPGLPAADLDRMTKLADEMEAGAGVDAFLRADREFHLASYGGAEAGQMSAIIHRMWNTTQHYRREFTKLAARSGMRDGPGLGITHMEHRLLLDCIRRQDADDAERVLVMHIRRTRLALEKHPDIFDLSGTPEECGGSWVVDDLTSPRFTARVANDCRFGFRIRGFSGAPVFGSTELEEERHWLAPRRLSGGSGPGGWASSSPRGC